MKDFFSSNTLAFENDLNYHYVSVLVLTFLLLNLGANMKILKLNIFFGLLLVFSFQASTVFACHEGGPMGFASEDPLASTTDYSSGSTFIFASTSGSLGCKNWDFVKNNRVQYLDIAWNKLSEEVAQGKGEHLVALSQMYGCQGEYKQTFESLLYGNYPRLFLDMESIESYERAHLLENEINILIERNGIKNQCTNISTS